MNETPYQSPFRQAAPPNTDPMAWPSQPASPYTHSESPFGRDPFIDAAWQPTTPTADLAPAQSHRVRKFIATGAVAVAAVGGGIAAYELTGSDTVQAGTTLASHESNQTANIFETVALPETIAQDVTKAISVSNCASETNVDNTITTYSKLFGTEVKPGTPVDQLKAQLSELQTQLTQDRSELGMKALPANFDELLADADTNPQAISLETYQKTIQDYVSPFGITVKFDWTKTDYSLDYVASPLSQQELDSSPHTRRYIVNLIQAFSDMSANEIAKLNKPTILFGDIHNYSDVTAAGEYMPRSNIIAFDIPNEAETSTSEHEIDHNVHEMLCNVSAHYDGTDQPPYDTAMASFAPVYNGATSENIMNTTGYLNGYTTLSGALADPTLKKYPVAFVEPYGARNAMEDNATEGEIYRTGQNIMDLLADNGLDTHILREKMSLQIARDDTVTPGTTDYYAHKFDVAKIMITLEDQIAPLDDQMADIEMNFQLSDDEKTKQLAPLQKKEQPLRDLLTEATTLGFGPEA